MIIVMSYCRGDYVTVYKRNKHNMGIFEEASVLSLISAASSDKEVEDCYSKLALNNDYDEFWNIVYSFADKNLRK